MNGNHRKCFAPELRVFFRLQIGIVRECTGNWDWISGGETVVGAGAPLALRQGIRYALL
jgi:hypothetical protein